MHELNPGADKDTVALKPTAPRRHYYLCKLMLDMPTFQSGGPRRPKSGNLLPRRFHPSHYHHSSPTPPSHSEHHQDPR